VIPFLQAVGKAEGENSILRRAADMLSALEAESNYIIKKWIKFGLKPKSATESQALLHLYNTYCKQKRCMDCQIGATLLTSTSHEA